VVFVSKTGRTKPCYVEDEDIHTISESENPYVDAVKIAAKLLNKPRLKNFNPFLHIKVDGLALHDDKVYTRVRWPTPAFFWRAIDRHKAMTSAELVTDLHHDYLVLRSAMNCWLDDAKKVHLVMTDERRDALQDIVGAVLPLLSEVGASDADREIIYKDAALCLWMSVQKNLPLDEARTRSLDRVLSLLDDTLVSPGA
jgi:hypothetical protein